jgi:hypothetical protein
MNDGVLACPFASLKRDVPEVNRATARHPLDDASLTSARQPFLFDNHRESIATCV